MTEINFALDKLLPCHNNGFLKCEVNISLNKYQYPKCIGVDVSYEFLQDTAVVTDVIATINGIDKQCDCSRCCRHSRIVLVDIVLKCGR